MVCGYARQDAVTPSFQILHCKSLLPLKASTKELRRYLKHDGLLSPSTDICHCNLALGRLAHPHRSTISPRWLHFTLTRSSPSLQETSTTNLAP
jgi:hypothetical protein